MNTDSVSLYAVGDVAAFFRNPESMFVHVSAVLREADILFAQNERHYADRWSEKDLVPGVPLTEIAPLAQAAALELGGFHVMSFASNHCMDLGGEAMLGTIKALQDHGITVIGAGRNIDEARAPALFERNGVKVGYLAYCSVGRDGWEAGKDRPGCAPLRASTFYKQVDYQPGTAPKIITIADREDLQAMRADIAKLRPLVDVLVISCHWGIHHVRALLADYEREVAHAAIDAGADLIVGHHPHVLKGIEIYRGKAVFYSMGNFAFDYPLSVRLERQKVLPSQRPSHAIDPAYAEHYSWPAESRKSMIVKCRVANKRVEKISFLPVLINTKAQPVVVTSERDLHDALANIEELSASQGLDTKFSLENGEIVVSASTTD